LLLIDCVSEHIHLALRYLIVNTVNSLKFLLSSDLGGYVENSKSDSESEKFTKIKEYSIFLYHLYDILSTLLRHLLSSHVDNYRDNVVIDSSISLLITLINYLCEIYSVDRSTSNTLSPFYENSNCYVYIVEPLQKLFESVLTTLREICKFNTTIKLNFEKIVERIAEKPSNKGAMIYILNFMFNMVNNEYTIETFIEIFRKVQKQPPNDVYFELESNIKNQTVRIGHLAEEKYFLQYLMDIALNSSNYWILSNTANLLISIKRIYVNKNRAKVYEQVCDYLNNHIINISSKIVKVNYSILQSKVN
jgi:hypothetical protein